MDLFNKWKSSPRQHKMMAVGLCGMTVLTVLVVVMIVSLFAGGSTKPSQDPLADTTVQDTTTPAQPTASKQETTVPEQETTVPEQETTAATAEDASPDLPDEDPQDSHSSSGETVDISTVITGDGETGNHTIGIDVSKYQGAIDWAQVASHGVEFAMIRAGYRTKINGQITADSNAKYNMQEAQKHGIKLGAYFFSTAITEAEAIEEANWLCDYISQYAITYPVAFNCEGFSDPENRQYSLTTAQRTDLALAFLDTVAQRGYTPMFYAAKVELENQAQWETSRLESRYKIWVAQYPSQPYPQTESSSYAGKHHMWQFTASGTVAGISTGVDMNLAYFGYENTQTPQDTTPPETVSPDAEALMTFSPVSEPVTAKIETNLRNLPSQGDESTVIYTLKNGETATRTGISDSGWSRIEWNGQVCYAVSSYLTTDLSYTPPAETQPEQTITTQFTPVNEQVTAKEVVNLRSIPSLTDESSVVVAQLTNGEYITRTGINTDVGWSRVEWSGQVLYCISSYLMLAEAGPTE